MTETTLAPAKSRAAYDWIRAKIINGGYAPGYRLVLGRIAAELGVSVVPVREAIRLLEAEGLVSFTRNVGAQVTMISSERYRETMETLLIIEAAATAQAAELLGRRDLDRASKINARLAAGLEDFVPRRHTELNRQFHQVLFDRCPNRQLLDLVHRTWGRLNTIRDSSFAAIPDRAKGSVAEHEQLLTMIRNGAAPAEVEQAVRDHRQATLDAFLTATERGEP